MAVILTVGHSTKPWDQFVELVRSRDIDTVIDVRSRPYSRFNPQYNKNRMMAELPVAGISYEWRGANLGGLDGNVLYAETIQALVDRAGTGERMVVMCSEGPFVKCHRNYMLTPDFQRKGLVVKHLLWTGVIVDAAPLMEDPTPVSDTPEESTLF